MKTSLKNQLFKAVGVDKDLHSVKLTQAPPIKTSEKGKFNVLKKFAVVQCDTIHMRTTSEGYKYVLTVVDVASRNMDAEPMRGASALDVIQAFTSIFKRKYITEDIITLYTDQGTEFKNKDFTEFMKDRGIGVRHSITNRHQQMGVVEYFNHLITRTIGTALTSEELDTNVEHNDWADMLPEIVKVLNKKENQKTVKLSDFFKPPRTTNTELNNRLDLGTVVHVRSQVPRDHLLATNNKLHGTHRNGDVRFELDVTEIVNVIILNNQPIRYMVKKYNNVSFIRKELLVATAQQVIEYKKLNPKEAPKEKFQLPESGPVTRSMTKKLQGS